MGAPRALPFFLRRSLTGSRPESALAGYVSRLRLLRRVPDGYYASSARMAGERRPQRGREALKLGFGLLSGLDREHSRWQPRSSEHVQWRHGSAVDGCRCRVGPRSCVVRAAQMRGEPSISQCAIQWRTVMLLTPFMLGARVRLLIRSGRAEPSLHATHGARSRRWTQNALRKSPRAPPSPMSDIEESRA